MSKRDLTGSDRKLAIQRWEANKPCGIDEMAAGLDMGYYAAWMLTKQPGFPLLGRLIFRDQFEVWRKERARVARAAARRSDPPNPTIHRPACGGRAGAPAPTNDSPTPWPPRAARLRALGV